MKNNRLHNLILSDFYFDLSTGNRVTRYLCSACGKEKDLSQVVFGQCRIMKNGKLVGVNRLRCQECRKKDKEKHR
jgi:hypothetical protein